MASGRVAEILSGVWAARPTAARCPRPGAGCARALPVNGVGPRADDRAGPGRHRRGHRRRGAGAGGPAVHPRRGPLRRRLAVRAPGPPARPGAHGAAAVAGLRRAARSQRASRAVFAFPLRVGAIRLGVLDLYRDDPGNPVPRAELAEALSLRRRGHPAPAAPADPGRRRRSRRPPSPCSTTGPRSTRRPALSRSKPGRLGRGSGPAPRPGLRRAASDR